MTTNLSLSKVFDTLVKREDGILLCKHSEIYNGAFGSDLCDWDIYIKDDYGQLCHPNEQLNYSDAWVEDMYEKVEPGDEDSDTIYMKTDFGEDKIPVRKLHEIPSDILQTFVDVEHGINRDEICITDDEVIQGKVYQAPNFTPQKYPSQPYEDAFLFVGEDGEEIYIERTSPFCEDDSRDIFEEITKEEFETFC